MFSHIIRRPVPRTMQGKIGSLYCTYTIEFRSIYSDYETLQSENWNEIELPFGITQDTDCIIFVLYTYAHQTAQYFVSSK